MKEYNKGLYSKSAKVAGAQAVAVFIGTILVLEFLFKLFIGAS